MLDYRWVLAQVPNSNSTQQQKKCPIAHVGPGAAAPASCGQSLPHRSGHTTLCPH